MARIAFCQDMMVEYMGFMYISAMLKQAGHTVEMFIDDQSDEDRYLTEVQTFRPDIVAFSILSPSEAWALRIGRRVKQTSRAVTVYGNVHAIIKPDIIQDPGVDIVCRGEGELPMRELAACVDRGVPFDRIRSFWVKTADGIVRNENPDCVLDLDTLPFHDRALYDKYSLFRHSKSLRFSNGRGCPGCCSFCTNPMLVRHYGGKRYIRKRSPELAIQELEFHIRQRDVDFLMFIDEVFWVTSEWLHEFLTLYGKRIRLPFCANLRLGGTITENDIRALAAAGARNLIVATETADERQRKEVMNKHVRNDRILQIAAWLRKYKVAYVCSAFFGLPGDTVRDHVERLGFFRRLKPVYLWTTFFQPYPGTALAQDPSIRRYMPENTEFGATLHHDMYLDLPDRARLVRLKKVYYACTLSPSFTPLLVWLTRFRIPLLFDALFAAHFMYYARRFERVSLRQFLAHVKVTVLGPLRRKRRRPRSPQRRLEPSLS